MVSHCFDIPYSYLYEFKELYFLEFSKGFRNEFNRLTEFGQTVPANHREEDRLESKMDNVMRGVQLVVATLKILNSDVTWIKKNISSITNVTEYVQGA